MCVRIRACIEKHLSAENDFAPDPAKDAGPVAKPPPAAETVIMATRAVHEGEPPVATPDTATEEQTTRVDSEAETPTPQMDDTRRALVNVFEYTYGALLPLLIFCLLICSADPAQEMLIGFLADAQPVVQEFDAANLIAGDTGFDRFEQLLRPAFLALAALFCLPVGTHGLAFSAMKLYELYRVQAGSERVVSYDMQVAEYVCGCIPLIGCIGIGAAFWKAKASEEALAIGLTQMPWLVSGWIFLLGVYAALFSPFKIVSGLARLSLAFGIKTSGQHWLGSVLFGPVFVLISYPSKGYDERKTLL